MADGKVLPSCVMQATDDEIVEVGHRVSKCLQAAGLSVQWNEDANDTISIKVQKKLVVLAWLCSAILIRCTSRNIGPDMACSVTVLDFEHQRLSLLYICGGSLHLHLVTGPDRC